MLRLGVLVVSLSQVVVLGWSVVSGTQADALRLYVGLGIGLLATAAEVVVPGDRERPVRVAAWLVALAGSVGLVASATSPYIAPPAVLAIPPVLVGAVVLPVVAFLVVAAAHLAVL